MIFNFCYLESSYLAEIIISTEVPNPLEFHPLDSDNVHQSLRLGPCVRSWSIQFQPGRREWGLRAFVGFRVV